MAPNSRIVIVDINADLAYIVFGNDERSFSSAPPGTPVMVPTETVLRYPPSKVKTDLAYHGGLVGRGFPRGGLPIQLLYWGSWWNKSDGPGPQLRRDLDHAVQTLL